MIKENRKAKQSLLNEKSSKRSNRFLIKKEKKFVCPNKFKTKKAKEIDNEIEILIKKAILASKNKSQSKSVVFDLTPEAKLIAANFKSNKGRLPQHWKMEL